MASAEVEELERRRRYWFEHYEEFRCNVVVRHDQVGPTVGVFDQMTGGLGVFASVSSQSIAPADRGEFAIVGTVVTVYGVRRTWAWDLRDTVVSVTPDLCAFRRPNDLVVYLRGPVMAPVCGAAWFNQVPGWDWSALRGVVP
jgi:hypothetical protein